jgi:hypothetical protein
MSKMLCASDLLRHLRSNEQRGSKPRCHFLTDGSKGEVARRLTALISSRTQIIAADHRMPAGFDATEEAQLDRAEDIVRSPEHRGILRDWWLAEPTPRSKTPTWDIVSTCSIDGRPGLLLIEAKAHERELINELCGKRFDEHSSRANHSKIAGAIAEANEGLRLATGWDWRLSSTSCYQISNRFAWAWKLCTLGYPVVLVYLGFIGATDMAKSFKTSDQWHSSVKGHSSALFPPEVWGSSISIDGATMTPLICTSSQPLAVSLCE